MIRFTCTHCDKALRADDAHAGSLIKCPGCGNKQTIPDAESEVPVPETELPPDEEPEPERLAPRKKKKRPRVHGMSPEASRGKVFVIVICCVVLGMHLLNLINYMAIPSRATPDKEAAMKQMRAVYEKLGKDVPKEVEQKFQQEFEKMSNSVDQQALPGQSRISRLVGASWMIGNFGLSAALLLCLYLRQDWARVVLSLLFLIGGAFGILGLFGGLALLRFLSAGAAVLMALHMIVGVAVNLGFGIALMKSKSIAAYTSAR